MSGTGTLRGAYAKTASRRQSILSAAVDVFSSSGYRDGSIREIAERVGMSQAGLLHHFSSKSELLAAVLEARDNIDLDRGRELFDSPDGIDSIRALLEILEHNQTVPGLVELHCVLSAEATAVDHPAHLYFVRRYAFVVETVSLAFDDMIAKHQVVEGTEAVPAARSLVAIMDGLQVQWLLTPGEFDMAVETRRYLGNILTVEL